MILQRWHEPFDRDRDLLVIQGRLQMSTRLREEIDRAHAGGLALEERIAERFNYHVRRRNRRAMARWVLGGAAVGFVAGLLIWSVVG